MYEQLILHSNYLTPHKLVLLVILTKFCNYEYTGIAVHKIICYLIDSIQHFDDYKEPTLGQVMVKLAAIENEADNTSIVDPVRERISQIQNPESIDQLIGSLMDLLLDNEDEEVNQLYIDMATLVTVYRVSLTTYVYEYIRAYLIKWSCVFGMFVRRCRVEYLKLSFEKTSELFAMFNSYRYGYASFMSSQPDEQSMMGKKSALDSPLDINADYIGGWVSNHDMARFLDREAQVLDSKPAFSYVSKYYLDRLNSLYTISAENGTSRVKPFELHDRLAFLQRHAPELVKACHVRFLSCIRVGEYEGAIENLHRFFDFCLLNRETPLYQYALLNLAILEHKFGHRQKALAAITEALDVARENHDEDCLSQALSWLTFIESKNNSEVTQKFFFGDNQSKNKNVAFLKSMDMLWDIKRNLQHGDAPRKVHENLIATSAIGTIHSLDRIFEFRNLLAASNWNQYGISALVDYYIQASVDIANEDTPVDQIEVAACMMAMQYISHLGIFKRALLRGWAGGFGQRNEGYELYQRVGIKATPTMRIDTLISGASTIGDQNKHDDFVEPSGTIHQLRHNLSQANHALNAMELRNTESGMLLDSCLMILSQVDISMEIEDYVNATSRLQECLQISQKCHSVLLYAFSCMKLADISIRNGQPSQAINIIDGLFTKVLSMNSQHLIAYTYLLRGKALFSLFMGGAQSGLEDRILLNCNHAQTCYEAIECIDGIKQAMSVKMLLYNRLDQISDRDSMINQIQNL
ncbi:hypothetical protein NQZ79_g2909 [Umbelopsis isabellina]|nr:hypothetical protein NQZ79_g2909 [Umbelopsis isabellina]